MSGYYHPDTLPSKVLSWRSDGSILLPTCQPARGGFKGGACCCRTVELVFVIVKVLEVDPNDLHFTLSQLRPLSKVQQKLTLKWHHNVMLKNYIFIGQRKLNNI